MLGTMLLPSRFFAERPTRRLWLELARSDGIPRRSLKVALVVGTILNLINQGDSLVPCAIGSLSTFSASKVHPTDRNFHHLFPQEPPFSRGKNLFTGKWHSHMWCHSWWQLMALSRPNSRIRRHLLRLLMHVSSQLPESAP